MKHETKKHDMVNFKYNIGDIVFMLSCGEFLKCKIERRYVHIIKGEKISELEAVPIPPSRYAQIKDAENLVYSYRLEILTDDEDPRKCYITHRVNEDELFDSEKDLANYVLIRCNSSLRFK